MIDTTLIVRLITYGLNQLCTTMSATQNISITKRIDIAAYGLCRHRKMLCQRLHRQKTMLAKQGNEFHVPYRDSFASSIDRHCTSIFLSFENGVNVIGRLLPPRDVQMNI